jgi:FMN-dependent NADH-azoreductase
MKTLLQINSSLFGSEGESSALARDFVSTWRVQNPQAQVIVRDLATDTPPHLTAAGFGAFLANPETRTGDQQAVVDYSDALIDELRRADVIVVGLPLYNFGVPSTLKAYFDQIARAGVTFDYTATGPVGLLEGKKVYVFATRGGQYIGTPLDTQTGYVRSFLAFLGMTDVEFVYAEGLAISEASKQAALAQARVDIDGLTRQEWKQAA